MSNPDLTTSQQNLLFNGLIDLCVYSYSKPAEIVTKVQNMKLQVVWGPADLSTVFVPYCLAFIAQSPGTGDYYVVIRGTDPESLTSWLKEDFAISTTKPFTDFVSSAPQNANISTGTWNGMNSLLKLTDPKSKLSMLDFLKSQSISSLYVTGHSLGGTLTPALYAYLSSNLPKVNCTPVSFAGLTSGDDNFAAYINGLVGNQNWRICNSLDIAPLMFESQDGVYDIYDSEKKKPQLLTKDLLYHLFKDAEGKNYTQPSGEIIMNGTFNTGNWFWDTEALFQHHATTYQNMVQKQFPLSGTA
ncbi:MAG: hypothetical protein K1X81_03010 [Bacteroidia bacterium]|nr:hypothetical protein [Bacteroidia bacterium]